MVNTHNFYEGDMQLKNAYKLLSLLPKEHITTVKGVKAISVARYTES